MEKEVQELSRHKKYRTPVKFVFQINNKYFFRISSFQISYGKYIYLKKIIITLTEI